MAPVSSLISLTSRTACPAPSGSQAAAAQALGIGPSYFGDLLRGHRNVSDRVLTKLGLRRIVVRKRK